MPTDGPADGDQPPASVPPSARVVEALAATEGVDPTAMDVQLHDAVDPDALDALADHDGSAWHISFTIGGHEVSVDSDGTVVVDERVFR
jgi:hypothetical protein